MQNLKAAITDGLETVGEHFENIIKNNVGETVFSELPVIKYAFSIDKIHRSIRDYRLFMRIERFIRGVSPQFDKSTFLLKFQTPEEKQRLCNILFNVIDKIEDEQKIDLMVNLFQSFLIGKISYMEFIRFSHIVSQCLYDDLKWLTGFVTPCFVQDNVELYGLTNTCLVQPDGADYGNCLDNGFNVGGDRYRRTELGAKFCDAAFEFHQYLPI